MAQTEAQRLLDEISSRLTTISSQVSTLAEAEQLGMVVTPNTTVDQARSYVDSIRPEIRASEKMKLPRTTVTIGGVKMNLPKDLVDSHFFQSADEGTKAMMAYSWEALVDNGHDLEKLIQAIDVAASQSDSYMKQQLRMFEDELSRSFGYLIEYSGIEERVTLQKMGDIREDLERSERLLARRQAELQEDLDYYSGELEIDKQRALSQALKNYDLQLESTRENLAERGLISSSIRSRAEKLLKEAHEDIVEDIETKTARQQRELTIGAERQRADIAYDLESQRIAAQRGISGLESQLELSKLQSQQSAMDMLRKGEAYIGTDKLQQLLASTGKSTSSLGELPLLGDITATGFAKDTHQDILSRTQSFLK